MERLRTHRPTRRAIVTAATAAVILAVGACGASPHTVSSRTPAADAPSATTIGATSPSTATPTPTPTQPPSPTPSATPPTTVTLKMGSSGTAVRQLQQRLTALGYWLGTPDAHFGGSTQQAVFALQKAAGLSPSGVVGTKTQAALAAGTRPAAKSTSGRVIEVNLKRDLLLFVTNGHVDHILNTSTGGGYVYYDQGERNVARTPKGHFKTYRVINGPHRSSLGLLIRPRYFTGGFAIHGDGSVPAHPASHGCVRVSNAAIDWIWAKNLDPIGTTVWIY